jgi:hypothetical protein
MDGSMHGAWMAACMLIAVGAVAALLWFAYRFGRLVERDQRRQP